MPSSATSWICQPRHRARATHSTHDSTHRLDTLTSATCLVDAERRNSLLQERTCVERQRTAVEITCCSGPSEDSRRSR